MRSGVISSVLIILLSTACLGGATMAWFTAGHEGSPTMFTAGTLAISEPVLENNGSWEPGECTTVQWSIENTGSKSSYIRVRLVEEYDSTAASETAWGVGSDFGQGNAQYFEYQKGEGSQAAPQMTALGAGHNYYPVGTVCVWDDGEDIFIRYSTYGNVFISETHLYAGLAPPTKSAPGRLGWQETVVEDHQQTYVRDHVFVDQSRPLQDVPFASLDQGTPIYLAAHAEVEVYAAAPQWTLGGCSQEWTAGDDGYYYSDRAAAGETVSICFTVCLPEGAGGNEYSVYLEAEAVQTTHNAVDYIWPQNPY